MLLSLSPTESSSPLPFLEPDVLRKPGCLNCPGHIPAGVSRALCPGLRSFHKPDAGLEVWPHSSLMMEGEAVWCVFIGKLRLSQDLALGDAGATDGHCPEQLFQWGSALLSYT